MNNYSEKSIILSNSIAQWDRYGLKKRTIHKTEFKFFMYVTFLCFLVETGRTRNKWQYPTYLCTYYVQRVIVPHTRESKLDIM